MQGNYRIWMPRAKHIILPPEPDFIIPNLVTDLGEQNYLKMIFQNVSLIAGGANFHVGLCNQTPAETTLLADITTEPTSAGGYARQTLARNTTGWPTITEINGKTVIRSATVTFTASGANFDTPFTRAFLATVGSGAGVLFSFSGAFPVAIEVPDGNSFAMQYEKYLG